MALSKQRAKDKKVRDSIYKALYEYSGDEPSIPEFSENRIPAEKYSEELTRKGIDEGVLCLVLINNMSGGSVGNVDLYRLLHNYLLDKDTREQINAVIKRTY